MEQPKEPETTQQKPPKPPTPPVDAKKKPREDSARLKGEADVETGQHALE